MGLNQLSPTFGIVVPTSNAASHLEHLLISITNQTCTEYTVVIVDQTSQDSTAALAQRYGCSLITVPTTKRYVPPSRSRNIGAASVHCDILLHLDADMEMASPDFLERLAGLFDADHQAAVVEEVDSAEGFWGKCKALERSCYPGSGLEAARAVTAELFSAVGGYSEEITTGEDLFITRQYEHLTKVRRANGLHIKHNLGRPSLRSMLRKKISYGTAAHGYLRKAREVGAPSAASIIWASVMAYVRNWRLIVSDPFHYLAIAPLRVAELFATLIGMFVRYADPRRLICF